VGDDVSAKMCRGTQCRSLARLAAGAPEAGYAKSLGQLELP